MRVLTRKLFRDLLRSRGMLLAVLLIITAGNTCFVALLSSYYDLDNARKFYYARNSMGDFWIDLKKCPTRQGLRVLEDYPEIQRVQPRIVFPVRVDIPEATEPVSGRILSLPARQDASTINRITVLRGSYFTYELRNQVICSDKFARARNIRPGDTITLLTGGVRKELVVTGTADSPEFIYLAAPGGIVSDPENYGVFYVKQDFAEDLFNFEGACNNLVGILTPRARKDPEPLLRELSRELAPWGVFTAYSRKEQFSALTIGSEIQGLRSLSIMMPLLFFGISALILNVLMTRMAEQQRTTVGTLKALGYPNSRLMLHYLGFGVAPGLGGALLGSILGVLSARGITLIYQTYFTLPDLKSTIYPGVILLALGMSVFFAALGTLRGLSHILALSPAEAMRLPAPRGGERFFLEQFSRFWKALGFSWQMVCRNLFRQPMRSIIALISSALGAAILLLAFGFLDSMDSMISFQFNKVLRSDYQITFKDPRPGEALDEITRLPGVCRGEPLFDVPGTFVNGAARKRGVISGISPESTLVAPRNAQGERVPLPSEGLLMTERMAKELGLSPGDSVAFSPVRGAKKRLILPVGGLVHSTFGLGVYAPLKWLNSLMGEEESLTGAALLFQPRSGKREKQAFLRAMAMRPKIETVGDIQRQKRITKEQFDGAMEGTAMVMILFAGIIFFGSILNNALIGLEERKREIATLKVLGFGDPQIGGLFLREILLTTLGGTLLGIPLGYWGLVGFMQSYQNDLYAFPSVILPQSYLWTVLLALGFALGSWSILYRCIRRMAWRDALNIKE